MTPRTTPPALWSGRPRRRLAQLLLASMMLAMPLVAAPAASAATSPWAFARPSLDYTGTHRLLTASQRQYPARAMTRKAWVDVLARFDARIAARTGATPKLQSITTGAKLSDVPATSRYAKAVSLGWISPIKGAFAGRQSITGDQAAKGVLGPLGLRHSSRLFARRLQVEVPRAGTIYELRAAQVYVRALGMRYNHLTGLERYEVGPKEPMRNAHVAYMIHKGDTATSWKLASLKAYETFDLPALGANQATTLRSGVRMLGQPYVWGGETEGTQPEGHGGFDCSGFIWRTLLYGEVPSSQLKMVAGRTTFDMSNIPNAGRITKAALQPADIMFFGEKGPKSTNLQNYHAGLYMGNGWFIHSSGGNGGVMIDRLDGWWGTEYSWGRRALRSA